MSMVNNISCLELKVEGVCMVDRYGSVVSVKQVELQRPAPFGC